MYVPTPSTVLVVEPSSNVAGTSSFIAHGYLASLNVGLPDCSLPFGPIDVTGSPVGVTGGYGWCVLSCYWCTILITRLTVTPVPVPVNDFSGTNVTVPSGATV